MPESYRILIADDEESLSRITSRVLATGGYTCDCVADAAKAEQELRNNDYDLLISDIRMPGNSGLELIRNLPKLAPGLPVILMTGYPTVATATEFVNLPIFSYLLKPLDYNVLVLHVRNAITRHNIFKAVKASETRLSDWMNNLGDLEGVVESYHSGSLDMGLNTFLTLTFNNMIGAFSELRTLIEVAHLGENANGPCRVLQCPIKNEFEVAMESAIDVLLQTKGAFKSKEIAEIRKKFEQILMEKRRSFRPTDNSISTQMSR